jgi:hypothetical protein
MQIEDQEIWLPMRAELGEVYDSISRLLNIEAAEWEIHSERAGQT